MLYHVLMKRNGVIDIYSLNTLIKRIYRPEQDLAVTMSIADSQINVNSSILQLEEI